MSPETASVIVHHSPEFSWSSVRFAAMGLRPVHPGQLGVYDPPARSNTVHFVVGLVEFAKALYSGRSPAHVLNLVITAVLEAVLETLLRRSAACA